MTKYEEELRTTIAKALLKYQQAEDLTHSELARRLKISRSQLGRYLNKNANMSVSVLCRIYELTKFKLFHDE